jgi:hypothetical protein
MMVESTRLVEIVQREVEAYERPVLLGLSYAISDLERQRYAVLIFPDASHKFKSGIVVMARIVDDTVIIEHDTTDRPLWKELVRAGIPREQIILAYAGEEAPAQPQP